MIDKTIHNLYKCFLEEKLTLQYIKYREESYRIAIAHFENCDVEHIIWGGHFSSNDSMFLDRFGIFK